MRLARGRKRTDLCLRSGLLERPRSIVVSRSTDKPSPFKHLPSLAVLAFLAAAGTQGFKQIAQSDEILDRAQSSGRYVFTSVDKPSRGTIYSSDGEILAQNQDAATVGIRFDRVPNAPGFFMAVAE